MRKRFWSTIVPVVATVVFLLVSVFPNAPKSLAQSGCSTFPETGMTVCGRFLQYWQDHGGLAQQGYPITQVLGEVSSVDGKLYTVQYFERAVFELHPENQPPHDVLLSLLGSMLYNRKYPGGAPSQTASNAPGTRLFTETGKHLGGGFLQYWETHGGLAQQGLPISEEFVEVSDLDNKSYRVQYFERAVFEFHPENPPATNILLSQLGTFRHKELTAQGYAWQVPPVAVPGASAQAPVPTTVPGQTAPPTRPPTDTAGFASYIMNKYNRLNNTPIEFEDLYTDDSSTILGHYITLDLEVSSTDVFHDAGRAVVQQWGDAIYAEARAAWPNDNFHIEIGWSTYSDDPCLDDCSDDCYYQSDNYTSGRGWYTSYTYVLITEDRGAYVCFYID